MSKTGKKSIEGQMHAGVDDDPFAPDNISLFVPDRTKEEEEVKISGGFLSTSQNTSNLFGAMLNVQREIKPLKSLRTTPTLKASMLTCMRSVSPLRNPL